MNGRDIRTADIVLLALFALLLLAASARGPDFGNYLDWAEAAFALDLEHADTSTLSPLGVPVLMWSHGSGFVFATGHVLLGVLGAIEFTALIVGWVVSLIFWAAMLRIIWLAASGDRLLTCLGVGVAFVGTHAGYYSHVHATESLALASAAILVWRGLMSR